MALTAHFSDDNESRSDENGAEGIVTAHSDDDDDDGDDGNGSPSQQRHTSSRTTTTTTTAPSKTNIPVVACALLASLTTGGTTYSFSLIANELKHSLHLSQSQLDTISAVFFLSGLLSFIPGGFADRFGTRFGISVGGITGCISLVVYWIVSKGFIPLISNNPSLVVAVLSCVGVAVFLSCACVTGSVFKIISCQCGPGSKGSAVGVAKGYVGLGSGLYAILFQSIRGPSTSDLDFLLLAAFFFIVAATIPTFITLPNRYKETHERLPDVFTPLHFRLLYGSLFSLAVIIIFTSLENLYKVEYRHHDESKSAPSADEGIAEATSSIKSPSTTTNYGLAITILVVWIGPIIAQLYLPQRTDYYMAANLTGINADHNYHNHRNDISDDDHLLDTSNADHEADRENPTVQETLNSSYSDDVVDPTASLPRKKLPVRSGHSRQTDNEENINTMGNALDSIMGSQPPDDHSRLEPLPCDEIVSNDDDDDEETPVILSARRQPSSIANDDDHERDKNLYEMLQTPTAWLLLWTGTILAGSGTVETNNLGQMVESLGFSSVVTPAALALFSVAQSGGRVMTGALSEAALTVDTSRCCIDRGIPRPFFFSAASLMSVVAHTILASATDEVPFIIGIFMSGVAFGMIWPLFVLCVAEFFGNDHVGANYMFYDGSISSLGTFLLAKVVAQQVYESHIDPHTSSGGGDNTCYGKGCFQTTHATIVYLSLTCVVTSIVIQLKTAHIYDKSYRLNRTSSAEQ